MVVASGWVQGSVIVSAARETCTMIAGILTSVIETQNTHNSLGGGGKKVLD
jgi:hypothetical protein